MNTKTIEQFEQLDMNTLSELNGGGKTDWGNAGKSAVYGAGIGVSLCAVAGVLSGGATLLATGACAWAGAKFGAAFSIIADNMN